MIKQEEQKNKQKKKTTVVGLLLIKRADSMTSASYNQSCFLIYLLKFYI